MGLFDTFMRKKPSPAPKREPRPPAARLLVGQGRAGQTRQESQRVLPDRAAPATQVQKTVREERADSTAKAHAAGKGEYAHRVLLRPIISEKTAHLSVMNQYVFEIAHSANKVMVKRAIRELYDAAPTRVRIITMGGKRVVRGRVTGTTSSYKKAIVTMPKGVSLPVYQGT